MSESSQLTVVTPTKASDQLAVFLGMEKGMMLETLKAQCFKGKRPEEVSDAQLAAFVSTASVLQVNPLVPGMLYAFPERNGGITPILGPDGVFKKLDEFIASGKLSGYECDVECDKDGKPVSATAMIHRASGQKPAKYTAYFSEWVVTSNPNWQARPRHMIWVRAIKQAARQVIHGLPMDADEYKLSQMQNVTPDGVTFEPAPESTKGAAGAVNAARNVTPAADPLPEGATPVDVTPPAEERAPARQRRGQALKPETTATPPAENPAPAATEQPAAKPAPEKAAEPLPPGAAPVPDKPRVFLQDGERVTVEVEVMDIITGNSKVGKELIPTVQAEVRGGFNGNVRHSGGASVNAAGVAVENPPWAKGAKVRLELFGKKSTSTTGPNVGKILNWVSKIEAIEGAQGQIPVEEA